MKCQSEDMHSRLSCETRKYTGNVNAGIYRGSLEGSNDSALRSSPLYLKLNPALRQSQLSKGFKAHSKTSLWLGPSGEENPQILGRKTQAKGIRDSLSQYHNRKWGFQVYKGAFGNDNDFTQFMTLLKEHALASLNGDDTGDQIVSSLELHVEDNIFKYDSASISDIRKHVSGRPGI